MITNQGLFLQMKLKNVENKLARERSGRYELYMPDFRKVRYPTVDIAYCRLWEKARIPLSLLRGSSLKGEARLNGKRQILPDSPLAF